MADLGLRMERPKHTGPFLTFLTTLASRSQLTSRMVRLTFAGGDLDGFEGAGPDTFVYLLVPPAGCDELVIDQSFSWETVREIPEALRPVGAYYTLSGHRPERAEVDIDVFLHDPNGPASSWAARAPIGAPLALWGPRRLYQPMPSDEHLLLVGDETALPAIREILASLEPGQTATAVIEVGGPTDQVPIEVGPGTSVVWLHRGDELARYSTQLLDTVRDLELPARTYAWGGGESRSMTRVRRHLHDERGIDPGSTEVIAYWRQGSSRADLERGSGEDDDE